MNEFIALDRHQLQHYILLLNPNRIIYGYASISYALYIEFTFVSYSPVYQILQEGQWIPDREKWIDRH